MAAPSPADPEHLARFSLEGRTAVVTGASRNIGAAVALGMAQAGADLVVVARDPGPLAAHAELIRSRTGRHVAEVAVDLRDESAPDAIAAAATQLPGDVDVLVNNAYVGGPVGPLLDASEHAWEDLLSVNLMAPLRLCRRFAASLRAHRGTVINVVSGSGLLPNADVGPYGVSKAALWMLTRCLAAELAPEIRVNALCPGITSPDGRPVHPVQEQLLPLVPMGRLARADELVGAAVYLASEAASYTTGALLIVNGGRPW